MSDAFARSLSRIMPGEVALAIASNSVYRPDESLTLTVDPANGSDPAYGAFFATQGMVNRHGAFATLGRVLEMYGSGSDFDIDIELATGQTHYARPDELGDTAFHVRGVMGYNAKLTIKPQQVTWTEVVAASDVTATGGSPQPSVTGTGTPYAGLTLNGLLAEITKDDASVQYATIKSNTDSALTVAALVTGTATSVRVVKPATVLQTSLPDGSQVDNDGFTVTAVDLRNEYPGGSTTFEVGDTPVVLRDICLVPVQRQFRGALTIQSASLSIYRVVLDLEAAFAVSGWSDNQYITSLQGDCAFVRWKEVGVYNPEGRAAQIGFWDLTESSWVELLGVVFEACTQLAIRGGRHFWAGTHFMNTPGSSAALNLSGCNFYPAYFPDTDSLPAFGSRTSIVGCNNVGLQLRGTKTNGYMMANTGGGQNGMEFESIGDDAIQLEQSAVLDIEDSAGGWVVTSATGYSVAFKGNGCRVYVGDNNLAGGTAGDIEFADLTADATFAGLSPSEEDTKQNFIGSY